MLANTGHLKDKLVSGTLFLTLPSSHLHSGFCSVTDFAPFFSNIQMNEHFSVYSRSRVISFHRTEKEVLLFGLSPTYVCYVQDRAVHVYIKAHAVCLCMRVWVYVARDNSSREHTRKACLQWHVCVTWRDSHWCNQCTNARLTQPPFLPKACQSLQDTEGWKGTMTERWAWCAMRL